MDINIIDLGTMEYQQALTRQKKTLQQRQQNKIKDTLLLVEHPPVITLGRNAAEEHVLLSSNRLAEEEIAVTTVGRGGDVTYHGPGQIVGYTIVDIKRSKIGIRNFVSHLEKTFIHLLREAYNIDAYQDPNHTGVWVDNKKIVAIGLSVKRGVTMHGFAFNVNTTLEHFNYIVPCGIQNKGVTSVKELLKETVDIEHVKPLVKKYFMQEFNK